MDIIDSMKKSATKGSVPFQIRLEEALHKALKKEAEGENRSLNNYIAHLLATDPRRQKAAGGK